LGQRLVAVVEVDLVVVRHESNLLTLKGLCHEMNVFRLCDVGFLKLLGSLFEKTKNTKILLASMKIISISNLYRKPHQSSFSVCFSVLVVFYSVHPPEEKPRRFAGHWRLSELFQAHRRIPEPIEVLRILDILVIHIVK
jgi:hypothetical protein